MTLSEYVKMLELYNAVAADDDETVRRITEKAAAVDGKLDRMLICLLEAGWDNSDNATSVVACLLAAGASLQARDRADKRTPLLYAAGIQNLELTQLLLSTAHARGELRERLQDVNHSSGHNVFHTVAHGTDVPTLRAFLGSLALLQPERDLVTTVGAGVGIDAFTQDIAKICVTYLPFSPLNARDADGQTPLIILTRLSTNPAALEAAKLLVQHGADPDLKTLARRGLTALELSQRRFDQLEGAGLWYTDEEREQKYAQAVRFISYLESVTNQKRCCPCGNAKTCAMPDPNCYCDICDEDIPKGTLMHSCRDCDWDMCMDCMNLSLTSRQQVEETR